MYSPNGQAARIQDVSSKNGRACLMKANTSADVGCVPPLKSCGKYIVSVACVCECHSNVISTSSANSVRSIGSPNVLWKVVRYCTMLLSPTPYQWTAT